jgi:NADPH:quinone reductase-like Zn-dependent oxidoreductase
MHAAVVRGPDQVPVFAEFDEPPRRDGVELVAVTASAVSNATRARAAGLHFSSPGEFPHVPGIDGVGTTSDGRRVAFLLPSSPWGGLGERTIVPAALCLPVPDELDDVTAAALINPGVSPVTSLRVRAALRAGETVLINGATGITGLVAVQVARRLGAGRVIATGRDPDALQRARSFGADVTIALSDDETTVDEALADAFRSGVDVVLDYLSGPAGERLLGTAGAGPNRAGELRFVMSGGVTGDRIAVPNAVVGRTPVSVLGSGIGSVSVPQILASVAEVLRLAAAEPIEVEIVESPLAQVETAWTADHGRARLVFRV